jgi:hypothetical protein
MAAEAFNGVNHAGVYYAKNVTGSSSFHVSSIADGTTIDTYRTATSTSAPGSGTRSTTVRYVQTSADRSGVIADNTSVVVNSFDPCQPYAALPDGAVSTLGSSLPVSQYISAKTALTLRSLRTRNQQYDLSDSRAQTL